MVDPIGLIALGIQVCSGLLGYYRSWKDSRRDVIELYQSLARISNMLVSIQEKIEGRQLNGSDADRVGACINSCTKPINALRMRLKKLEESASHSKTERLKSFKNRAQFPFEKTTLLELKANVSDIRADLTEAMAILHMDISLNIDRKIDEMDQHIAHGVMQGIQNIQEHEMDRAAREERAAILSWLSSLSPSTFTERQDASLSRRAKDTGGWIFEDEEMKRWLTGTTPLLWCPGGPGSGKSVAMYVSTCDPYAAHVCTNYYLYRSIIVEYLEHARIGNNTSVAYTYCVYNQEYQTAANLIASIIAQLARQNPKASLDLKDLWKSYSGTPSKPSLEEYVRLLKALFQQSTQAFVLVDALDELSEGERRLLVRHLLTLAPDIQVLVTSRSLPSIQFLLKDSARMEIQAHDEDMRTSLESRIKQEDFLRKSVEQDPLLHDKIINTIIHKANGMFLVAELHITALSQEDNIRDLRESLESLPAEIADIYSHTLLRIGSQNHNQARRAHQVLLWLTHACRPLQVRELQQALAVRPNDTEFVSGGEPSMEALVSSCMGLVVVDRQKSPRVPRRQRWVDIIRFVHYTAQEFFEAMRRQQYPEGHRIVAESCLRILSLSNLNIAACNEVSFLGIVTLEPVGLQSLRENLSMVLYASQHWGDHARLALEASPTSALQAAIMNFFRRHNNFVLSTLIASNVRGYPSSSHLQVFAAHIVAGFGISGMIEAVSGMQKETHIDIRDSLGQTPLHWACLNGHLNTVKMLLGRGADKNVRSRKNLNSLDLAISAGRTEVVKFLLEVGVDMTDRILSAASKLGDEDIVRLLLEKAGREEDESSIMLALKQAAFDGTESTVRTIIHAGRAFGKKSKWPSEALSMVSSELRREDGRSKSRIALVKFLLAEGADPNYSGSCFGNTSPPLFDAVVSLKAVKLLVHSGALVNVQDSRGLTLFHETCLPIETIKFLVSRGADVKRRDNLGRTLLHNTFRCTTETLTFLLELHAEVNAQDWNGTTALMVAINTSDPSKVIALLQVGADITLKDKDGYTALHHAAFRGQVSFCEILLQHNDSTADQAFVLQMARLYHSLHEFWEEHRRNDPAVRAKFDHETAVLLDEIGQTKLRAYGDFLNLEYPCKLGYAYVAKLYLNAGVDLQLQGASAIFHALAAVNGQTGAIEILGLLFDHGLPVDTKDPQGKTALSLAINYNLAEMVKFLLHKNADVEADSGYGSLLMSAINGMPKAEEILTLLLDHGANFDRAWDLPLFVEPGGIRSDSIGMTALHVCAMKNASVAIVSLLVRRGANIEALLSSGETPLNLAVRNGRPKIVEVLLAEGADPIGPSSLEEHDKLPGVYEVDFRESLHLVQEAHRKRNANISNKKRMRSASPDTSVKTLVRR